MATPIGRLFRALGAPASESYAEIVVVGNLAASLILGGAAWLFWDVAIRVACSIAAGLFAALTACLFSRYTAWISAVVGGAALSVCPAGLLAGVGMRVGSDAGAWIGGAVGLAFGLGVSFMSHRNVVRALGDKNQAH